VRIRARLGPGSWVRLASFAGLTALAAWRYSGIEARPPEARLAALVVLATAGLVLLTLTGARADSSPPDSSPLDSSRPDRHRAAAARAAVMVLLFILALLAAGLPARLLLPTEWGSLAHGVHRGMSTIANTVWPYVGTDRWARLDILLGLAVLLAAAAAIGCVPSPADGHADTVRHRLRRLGALAVLMSLYVIGVLDANGGSAILEGLLLLALLAGWLWLPALRARQTVAAFAWLTAAGAAAVPLAAGLDGGRAWFDYRAWNLLGAGAGETAFSWDQTYGPIPWSRSQRIMFSVRAPRPGLWKVTTLDRFDGLRFVRSGTQASRNEDLPLPLNDRWYRFATFTLAGLSTRLLPTEQGTTAGVNFDHPLHYDQDGTVSTLARSLRGGDTYTVLSYVPTPTPAELRSATRAFPGPYRRYTDFDLPTAGQSGLRVAGDPVHAAEFFTSRTVSVSVAGRSRAAELRVRRLILASPYGPAYRLARRLATGLHSTYDVALATENYLKANYAYSDQSPKRRYPLEAFLFTDRIGYCQQFSGTMALMLRMDGIPARVAAGFLPGSSDPAGGGYRVRARDAHSWVEVYFTGIGWVPFDPTPPRSVGAPQGPLFTSQTSANRAAAVAATVRGPLLPQRDQMQLTRRHPRAGVPPAVRVTAFAAALVAALLLVTTAVRWWAGRRRLQRSLAGDGELAVRELTRGLRRLGYALPATVTLAQIERLVRLHGGDQAAFYVTLLRDRRYACSRGHPPTLRDRRRLRTGLTAHLGLDARLLGHWALPPGTTAWRLRPRGQLGPGAP
jgi:transglutaminase-like putative cysteine protease